jgi:hypothetical protein
MAIKFKTIQRGQPGVAGGGVKKYYAIPVMDGELNLDGLTKAIEKICTVSGADIRAVLYALVDVYQWTALITPKSSAWVTWAASVSHSIPKARIRKRK